MKDTAELKRLIATREKSRAKLVAQLAKINAELDGLRQGLAVVEGVTVPQKSAAEHPTK